MTLHNSKVTRIWDSCGDETWLRGNGTGRGRMKWRMRRLIDLWEGITHSAATPAKLLDSCIRRTVNEDISMPSVTSLIWCSLSFTFFPSISGDGTISLGVSQSFSVFSMYLFISLPSYLPRHGRIVSTFPHFFFYLRYLFIQPPDSYLYLFRWFLLPCLPHHLSSFHFSSLINTITAPLMCASPSVCP